MNDEAEGYCNSVDYARPLGLAFIFFLPPDLKASFRRGKGKNNARLFVGRCLLVFCLTFDS